MNRQGARDAAFRPSSLAMAGERSFRANAHGRNVFAQGMEGRGGRGGGGGGSGFRQYKQHGSSRRGDFRRGGGGGSRAIRGRYQQPALFQFENPLESHGQVALGRGAGQGQLPFLEQAALSGRVGARSPKRVRTALPAISGSRGGGFNMLPIMNEVETAWGL